MALAESPTKRTLGRGSNQLPSPVRLPPWAPPPANQLVDTRAFTNPEGYFNGRSIDQTAMVHFVSIGRQSTMNGELVHKPKGPGYGMNKGIHILPHEKLQMPRLSKTSPKRSPYEMGRFGHATPPKIDIRPVKWSAKEAKAARIEHAAAEQERSAYEALYRQQDTITLAEQTAMLQLAAEEASTWTVAAVFSFPLVLGALATACGFNSGASALAIALPLAALSAAVATPLTSDSAALAKQRGRGGCKSWLEARQELVGKLVQCVVGLAALVQASLLLLSFEAWCVDSGVLPADRWVPPEWMRTTNVLAALLLVVCTTYSLVDTFIWLVKNAPRVCCLPSMDRIGERQRRANFVLMRTVEAIVRKQVAQLRQWCAPTPGSLRSERLMNRWRQPSKLTLLDDFFDTHDVFDAPMHPVRPRTVFVLPSDLEENADGSFSFRRVDSHATFEHARASPHIVALAAWINSIGAHVRLAPLKTAIMSMYFVVAAQGMAVLSAPTVLALVSALATALSGSEFVRVVTSEVAHAEGVRSEQERRQHGEALKKAEERLRSMILESTRQIDERKLTCAIDDALTANVPINIVKQASEALRLVREFKVGQEEVAKETLKMEETRRERAIEALQDAMAGDPLELSLAELRNAIENAIVADVPKSRISKAKEALSKASHAQSFHARAVARLQAFLDLDPQADAPQSGSEPASPFGKRVDKPAEEDVCGAASGMLAPAAAPEAAPAPPSASEMSATDSASDHVSETAKRALCTIDVQELDEALEEARRAGVNSNLIKRAHGMRVKALLAQANLTAAATLFYVRLRRKGKESRWVNSGGEDRLLEAIAAGREALEVLHGQQKALPLSEAIPPLENALSETKAANVAVRGSMLSEGESLLTELVEARDAVRTAQQLLEAAIESVSDVATQSQLLSAEEKLMQLIPAAQRADVDNHIVSEAEAKLKRLRVQIREAVGVADRVYRAMAFCKEQLKLFRSGSNSQLKMIAIPQLEGALAAAKSKPVPEDLIVSANSILREALEARGEAEKAASFITSAAKMGVKALSRVGEESDEAEMALESAVETLASALQGVRMNGGVDEAELAGANELLDSMRTSFRRAKVRRGNTAPSIVLALN